MAKPMKTENSKERCVAGFVKARRNRDKSITFTVAGKEGERFTLSEKSEHAKTLHGARRALVKYQDGERNPKVLVVIENPSAKLIREYNADCQ